jgi:hypothetical protein
VRYDLSQRASEAVALIDKYSKGGSHYAVLEKLRRLRHERLAHRQIEGMPVTAADEEIESFYQGNLELIRLLQCLVEGIAYDPDGTAETFHLYAKSFWAGVRGERTEGHPDYRAPSTGLEVAERR